MFKNLEDKEMNVVIDGMEAKTFQPNDMVITQGDDGDELFLVSMGKLKCFKVFPGNTKATFLKTYFAKEIFGELALLYNTPRAASIQAIDSSVLYSLDRQCFNHIVKESAIRNRNMFETFLSKVEILQSLDNYERGRVCDCIEMVKISKGERVIKEGENGEAFYLVVEGTAIALKYNPNSKKEEKVYEYEKNMYFGELALLRNEPRAASILATSDMKLAQIQRKAFKRLLGPLEDILKRNAKRYIKFLVPKKK